MAVKNLLEGEVEGLTRKAVQLALSGDTTALKLCLDRIAPIRRGAPVPFDLPKMETIADMPNAVAAVSRAMAEGELSPEEAVHVTSVLDLHRRALETVALEARIRALEAAAGVGGSEGG